MKNMNTVIKFCIARIMLNCVNANPFYYGIGKVPMIYMIVTNTKFCEMFVAKHIV